MACIKASPALASRSLAVVESCGVFVGGGCGAGGVRIMPACAELTNTNSIAETLIAFSIVLFLIVFMRLVTELAVTLVERCGGFFVPQKFWRHKERLTSHDFSR